MQNVLAAYNAHVAAINSFKVGNYSESFDFFRVAALRLRDAGLTRMADVLVEQSEIVTPFMDNANG